MTNCCLRSGAATIAANLCANMLQLLLLLRLRWCLCPNHRGAGASACIRTNYVVIYNEDDVISISARRQRRLVG